MFGIIGGSGLTRLAALQDVRRETVQTPWGDPSCALTRGRLGAQEVIFLARHGDEHTLPPHRINYRANLWALRQAGVDAVFSIATVGGIGDANGPGALVVPDQLIDYTWGRASTFFDGVGQPVTHVDFTHPFDESLRQRLMAAAARLGEPVIDAGTYGCTQGPRLETAAEVRALGRDGCTLVGMTGMPEAVLARELGLPYAMLAVVVNHAAGMGASRQGIALESLGQVLEASMQRVIQVLKAAVGG